MWLVPFYIYAHLLEVFIVVNVLSLLSVLQVVALRRERVISAHRRSQHTNLDVLPHGVDDGWPCGGVYSQEASQLAGQLVLEWLHQESM